MVATVGRPYLAIETDPKTKQVLPTDSVDGFLRGERYLLHDRDPLFTEAFRAILRAAGSGMDPDGSSHRNASDLSSCANVRRSKRACVAYLFDETNTELQHPPIDHLPPRVRLTHTGVL